MSRNNGTPACASCKHQRKKCTEKCILAPLFPASKSCEFQAVNKIFGVSNVTKMVKSLKEEDRKRAADSLIWEAFCRQRDPILGPYGEFAKVREELKLYRSYHLSTPYGMVYKPTANLGGWDSNNNKNGGVHSYINNGYINNNVNNSNIAGLSSCGFSLDNHHIQDTGPLVLLPPQHNSIHDFNCHYFLPGRISSTEAKEIETTLWNGSS